MTELAVRAGLLGLNFDPYHLYKQDDPNYELWLSVVIDLISEHNRSH